MTASSSTILVVDDSESIRVQLAEILSAGGYKVVTACDGREAMQRLAAGGMDLVVTDIFMPGTDGIELLTAMHGLKRRPRVIAMSSGTGEYDMLRAAKLLGAGRLLRKPFPPDELLRHVRDMLAASR